MKKIIHITESGWKDCLREQDRNKSGIYMYYWGNKLVYIGKSSDIFFRATRIYHKSFLNSLNNRVMQSIVSTIRPNRIRIEVILMKKDIIHDMEKKLISMITASTYLKQERTFTLDWMLSEMQKKLVLITSI